MFIYIVLFCIFLLIRPFLHRPNRKNLPPGPTGLPIIGSIHKLGNKPNEFFSQLSKRYGPIISLRLGSITTVVVSSPELSQEVMQKQESIFPNHPIPDAWLSMPSPTGLLAWNTRDKAWRSRRRLYINGMFTPFQLDSLQHLRQQKIQNLITHLRKKADSGSQVDIGELTFATMLNLMSNTIFSTDVVDAEFKAAGGFKDAIGSIMEAAGAPNLSDYFPALKVFDVQGIRRKLKPCYARLFVIFDKLIDEHMEKRAAGIKSGDLMDVFLDQNQEDEDIYSLANLKTMILELFMAGSDTSGLTTEWAMAELLHNPEAMKAAKNEISQVIGNGEVKESDLSKLPYIQAIMRETIRMHAISPVLLPHLAEKDTELGGYYVPKGSYVFVNVWDIQRNPKYWEDPLSFKPERFLENKKDFTGKDYDFVPFGAGRRICPAIPLASRMVTLMLASMIHNFDWKLPNGMTPKDMNMDEHFGISLRKEESVYAIPSRSRLEGGN